MSELISSLDAHRYLRATMTASSSQAGWRSLLLRAYDDPPEAEFTTPATTDHLIVLVTEGTCNVEARYRGRWQTATYTAGSLGMTAPREEVTLRWRGATRHSTLQLHLPAATVRASMEQLSGHSCGAEILPNGISYDDPLIRSLILNLAEAMRRGTPDIYAESAAELLAAHLVVSHAHVSPRKPPSRDLTRMRRVRDYMQANLGADLSLDSLAHVACLSRFHLIRMFKLVYGETPHQFLTRLRIEEACRRLKRTSEPISSIALHCGYTNSTHFAAAFRRLVRMTPTAYKAAAAGADGPRPAREAPARNSPVSGDPDRSGLTVAPAE
jgi:AraC family transcriptional regulator